MQSDTSFAQRLVAFFSALGVTCATLAGIAFLAQPLNRGAEPAAGRIAAATPAAVAVADDTAATERLRITVVGTRRGSLAAAPDEVRAQQPCSPPEAHRRYTRTTVATSGRPSKV